MTASDRRGRARPVVGVLQRDPLGLYSEQWLGGVDAARTSGCDLLCFFGGPLDEPGFGRHANAIYDLVTEETVDGLVVWTTALGYHLGPERMVEFCRRFDRLPMVTVEEPAGSAPVVTMTERQGMDEAVSHLIEVHGHQRIAFIRGALTHSGAQRRFQGYLDAMARHRLAVPPELVSAPLSSPGLVATAATSMLKLAERPDAIVTPHDDFAVCVLFTLATAGVRTPEDIAVVGFDDRIDLLPGGALDSMDTPIGLYFDSGGQDWPGSTDRPDSLNALSLTTVRAPFEEMGRRAVEVLLGLIRGETVPPAVEIPTELVVRHTCGCPPGTQATPDPPTGAGQVRQLRAALTDRLTPLPADWAQRVSNAFVAETRGGSDGDFRMVLSQILPVSVWSGERVEHWWQALSALRQLVGDTTAGSAASIRADELLRYAHALLSETAEKYWRYGQVLGEKRYEIAREVGRELIAAPDVARLAEVLANALPKLGIPGCYLACYGAAGSSPPHPAQPNLPASRARSRLVLAYQDGARVDTGTAAEAFASVQLVPGDRLRRPTRSSLVVLPLYFRSQQLGFVLFELGPRIGWIYTTLQEQLSSALHRVLLIERDRAARAAVAEAHRRAERQRLAGELHDSVSQALFSMTLHTRALQLALQQDSGDPNGRLARGLTELRELTQSALSEMRSLILQMRPESLHEEGLVVALRRYAASVASREGLDIGFHAPELRLSLDPRVEEELLRVVQEAVHNSVKHARPRRIDLTVLAPAEQPGDLIVEVADDGTGFDPKISRPGHLGLHIMRERIERIGGQLTVDSSPSRSTTIRALLPGLLNQDGG
jgi:signal transduction histidine kinase/DNA-binding LacI/PurR family transcriptional regulator